MINLGSEESKWLPRIEKKEEKHLHKMEDSLEDIVEDGEWRGYLPGYKTSDDV